nr:toprim domain-containing protein [Anaerolineae bacterium]
EDNPKYLNSPQSVMFDKSQILFGLDTAREGIRQTETVVIVEGYLDVIQAQQAGFANVVAQMGTALTDGQLRKVAPRLAKKVILALDSDAAGQNATMRSLEVARRALSEDIGGKLQIDIRVLNIPDAKDPDDFIRETPGEWPGVIEKARPVADFVIDFETRELPHDASIMEREAVARRVLPLLMAAERDLYRQDNLQKLAVRLRIDERTLMRWAATEAKSFEKPKPAAPTRPEPDAQPPAYGAPPDLPPRAQLDEPPMYDEYGAPMDYDDDFGGLEVVTVKPPPVVSAGREALPPTPAAGELALEQHCLSMLVEDPQLLYQMNRRLRQLANNNPVLLAGPLAEFGAEDFDDAGLRALWPLLFESLAQDDLDPSRYLLQAADGSVRVVLDALRQPDRARATGILNARLEAETATSWEQHEKRRSGLFGGNPDEPVHAALRLRSSRLQREGEALQSLIRDAEEEGDADQSRALAQQLVLLATARHRIDAEMKSNRRF